MFLRYLCMNNFFVIIFCTFLSLQSVFSQIDFRCVEVLTNGDVRLHWLPVADPLGEFVNYQIYYSTDKINFIPLTAPLHITNRLITTFTHVGANANLASVHYKMVAEFNNGAPYYPYPDSDTLSSMFVQVLNTLPQEDGYAHIEWNPIRTPKLPSTSNNYDIFKKENILDPWGSIALSTFGNEKYDDPVKYCQDTLYYKIEVTDASGCTSVSSEGRGIIIDKKAPGSPILDSVTVNYTTNEVFLSWKPDASIDIGGYIIIRDGVIIATVAGALNTTYTDVSASPNTKSLSYSIAAFDACLIQNPPAPPTSNTSAALSVHKSIYLQATANNCEKSIRLNWTPYNGWFSGVQEYYIFAQENSGAWDVIDTVSGTTTTYIHQNLQPGTQYCYYVQAKSNDLVRITSSSNLICLKTSLIKNPAALYISCIDVEDNQQIAITFFVPKNSDPTGYNILRADTSDSVFTVIATIPPSKTDSIYLWKDMEVQADSTIYLYKIAALDSCDNEYFYSDTVHSILLTADSTIYFEFQNNLHWNAYTGFSFAGSQVKKYNLYRSMNGAPNFVQIEDLTNTQLFYTDKNLDDFLNDNGEFCYYVEAEEDSFLNVYGLAHICKSNTLCLTHKEMVWIPNTFTPDGDDINDVFKPVLGYVDQSDYLFIIYNRWGEKAYETLTPGNGWDGGGYDAPIGYYSYFLQYKNADKIVKTIRGSFLLIR